LKQYKVDTSMVKKDEKLPTTIAFVSRDANGERDFQFNRGADQNLEQQDLSLNKIWKSSIFHFGSATALLEGALQRTYLDLMQEIGRASCREGEVGKVGEVVINERRERKQR